MLKPKFQIMSDYLSLIISCIAIVGLFFGSFYVYNTYISPAGKDAARVTSYAKSVTGIGDQNETGSGESAITVTLSGKPFTSGKTLSDFAKALKDTEDTNRQKTITITITDSLSGTVMKTVQAKYGDFSYSLGSVRIAEAIRSALVRGDQSIDINLAEYVSFDQNAFLQWYNPIRNAFQDTEAGTIVFDNKTKSFIANGTKSYISKIVKEDAKITQVTKSPFLEDADITLSILTQANPIKNIAESLNSKVADLRGFSVVVKTSTKGNGKNSKDAAKSMVDGSKWLDASGGDDFKLRLKAGFVTEYLKFDPTSNSITLDSEKFKKDFSKLSNLSIQSRKSEIIPSGSLLQVYDGGVEDNIPTANDFAYISHDEGKKLLFDGFTSEVSSAIDSIVLGNKTFSGTELDISNKNLFVSSEPKAALPIKVNIIERSELSRVVIPTLPPISNILSPGNEFFSVESSKFPATVSFSSEGNVEYRSNGLFVGEKQIANVDVSGYRVFISPTPDFSKILGSGDWDQDENGQYSFDFGKTVKVWDGDEYISFSFITNQKDTVKQFIDALPNNIGQSIQAVKKGNVYVFSIAPDENGLFVYKTKLGSERAFFYKLEATPDTSGNNTTNAQ